MGFFDTYRMEPRCPVEAEELRSRGVPENEIGPDDPRCRCGTCDPTAQNDLRGTCERCSSARDDVLLGICGACAGGSA